MGGLGLGRGGASRCLIDEHGHNGGGGSGGREGNMEAAAGTVGSRQSPRAAAGAVGEGRKKQYMDCRKVGHEGRVGQTLLPARSYSLNARSLASLIGGCPASPSRRLSCEDGTARRRQQGGVNERKRIGIWGRMQSRGVGKTKTVSSNRR